MYGRQRPPTALDTAYNLRKEPWHRCLLGGEEDATETPWWAVPTLPFFDLCLDGPVRCPCVCYPRGMAPPEIEDVELLTELDALPEKLPGWADAPLTREPAGICPALVGRASATAGLSRSAR